VEVFCRDQRRREIMGIIVGSANLQHRFRIQRGSPPEKLPLKYEVQDERFK
jgi:hypothetical protein